eukprot:Skav224387  [mRNA]  locus=scaffold3483:16790:17749:- [translate_table: standard]
MRSWYYGCSHTASKLCCSNGTLSLELLERSDAKYHEAVVKGLEWEVISRVIVEEFPNFPQLGQSAANAAQQVARPETEFQLAMKMVGLFKSHGGTEVIPFSAIGPAMLRTKPPCPESIPQIYQFLLKCGGGRSAHLMLQSEKFIRAHGHSGRALGESLWQALSTEIKGQNQEQLVLWRHAVLKALFALKDKSFSASDVKKSLGNPEMFKKAMEFERVYQQLRKVGQGITELGEPQLVQGLGVFEVECAMIIFGKKLKDVQLPFELHEDIRFSAHKCIKYWETVAEVAVSSPWETFVESQQSSSSAAAASSKTEKGRTAG